MKLITYGCGTEFDPTKFNSIKNRAFIKPDGGLWASPVNSSFGWKEWCEAEGFGNLDTSFTFEFSGTIYKIDGLDDAKHMPWVDIVDGLAQYPDFEKIAESYDAIWLTAKGQIETRYSEPMGL